MALDISDMSLPDTSVAPELFSERDHPTSIKERFLYHRGQWEFASQFGLSMLCVHVGTHGCVRLWEGETLTQIDCTSVGMIGQLSHNWHRIIGPIRVLGADLGRESCEKPPLVCRGTEAFLHSRTA